MGSASEAAKLARLQASGEPHLFLLICMHATTLLLVAEPKKLLYKNKINFSIPKGFVRPITQVPCVLNAKKAFLGTLSLNALVAHLLL